MNKILSVLFVLSTVFVMMHSAPSKLQGSKPPPQGFQGSQPPQGSKPPPKQGSQRSQPPEGSKPPSPPQGSQ